MNLKDKNIKGNLLGGAELDRNGQWGNLYNKRKASGKCRIRLESDSTVGYCCGKASILVGEVNIMIQVIMNEVWCVEMVLGMICMMI